MKQSPEEQGLAGALKADADAAKASGVGVKMMAEAFGRSESWTYEMIRGEQPFPLSQFPVWVELTGGKHAAQWMAEQAQCDLVPWKAVSDAETSILSAMKEATEAVSSASKALQDGRVTAAELADYRKEMTESIEELRKLGRLLRELHEEGNRKGGRAKTLRDTQGMGE